MFCILWPVWLVVLWDLFDWLCSEICLIGRVLRPVWLVVFWDLFDWSCSEICLIGRVLRSVWLVVFWDLFDWLCFEICLIGCVLRSVRAIHGQPSGVLILSCACVFWWKQYLIKPSKSAVSYLWLVLMKALLDLTFWLSSTVVNLKINWCL